MDASRYLREKMRGQQVYKSNWQPRDASEVTLRNNAIAQANNSTTHRGPLPQCCSDNTIRVPLPNPGKGFSTSYSSQIVSQRIAGCVQCNDPVFGKPGGVITHECCDDVQPIQVEVQPAIYGAYITNARFMAHSSVDAQGNTWIIIQQLDLSLPMNIYNRYGVLVQSVSANLPYVVGAIVYISADGVSNIWVQRIVSSGFVLLSRDQGSSIFDSQGNFIVQLNIQGSLSTTYLQIFDTQSVSYFQYSAAAGDFSPESFLLKISPTGVWNGSTDPNTWVGRILYNNLLVSTNNTNFIYILNIDNADNIILNAIVTNTTGSTQTVRTFDKTGTQFGTSIPIVSGTSDIRHSILVKFASNGGSTGSWNAYIYNTVAVSAYSIYSNNLRITSTNQIVFAFQYIGNGNEVRGSDNLIIGASLPYTPTIFTEAFYTCIAVFSPDGTAANSFRMIIRPVTGGKKVVPISICLDSSDSIFCFGVAQEYNLIETIQPLNALDSPSVGVQFVGNFGNVFFVKFTNTGVPIWTTSLKGQNGASNTIFGGLYSTASFMPGGPDNAFLQNQYLNAYIDPQENVVAQIIYFNGTASYYNTSDTFVKSIASPSTVSDTCILKVSSDGSIAYLARIGQVAAGTPASTFIFRLYFDSSNNINVLGWYLDNPCGFYSNTDDTTPLVQVPTAVSGSVNQFLAVYTPTLSSVQVARVVPTTINTRAIPYAMQQVNTEYIVLGQNNGPISIFNFGNYTTIPNETRAFQGVWDVYLINFSTDSSKFWTIILGSSLIDLLGSIDNGLIFYQYSQLRISETGQIRFPINAYSTVSIYDRTTASVTSILNNQTASPGPFTLAVTVPLDGYNIQPVAVTEAVQPQPPSSSCYCADPGIYRQPFPVDCSIVQPSYTGALNQTPILANQQYGHLPKQQYPYPSG